MIPFECFFVHFPSGCIALGPQQAKHVSELPSRVIPSAETAAAAREHAAAAAGHVAAAGREVRAPAHFRECLGFVRLNLRSSSSHHFSFLHFQHCQCRKAFSDPPCARVPCSRQAATQENAKKVLMYGAAGGALAVAGGAGVSLFWFRKLADQ